jgi:phenylacetate-CoA ligase
VANPLFRHFVSFAAVPEREIAPVLPSRWRPLRVTFLSVFTEPARSIEQLDRLRPQILGGFPSHFAELIAAYAAAGQTPPRVPVIFTSSEHLSAADRARIERAFAGRVYNVYGSTEFKEIAWECRSGRYHVNFETVYVETEPRPDLGQALLITGLANRAMPLLRFDLGDLGELGQGRCACGRQSPYVARIHGRQVEQLELPSGRRVSPYLLTTLIERHPGVRKYQMVQERPERLRIDVVMPNGSGSQTFAPIAAEIERALGGEVAVEFRPVEAIERTRAGKHRVLVRPA